MYKAECRRGDWFKSLDEVIIGAFYGVQGLSERAHMQKGRCVVKLYEWPLSPRHALI